MTASPNIETDPVETSVQEIAPLKYQQVENEIRQLIRTLPVGARLPSERSIARLYECNFLTVRKALKRLVEEGWIVRRVGSGTFVNSKPLANGRAGAEPRLRELANAAEGKEFANRVGLLVLSSSNTYANRLLQEIARTGLREGVEVVSRWVVDFSDDALLQAELLRAEGCQALVLPWFPFEMAEAVRDFVLRSPLQVSLPMPVPGLERNCFVNPVLFGGGSQRAVEALAAYYHELGVHTLAFLGPDSPTDTILQKSLTAYACCTSREGAPSLCGLVAPGGRAMDQLVQRWRKYCNKESTLGIISYDDEHALRFMTAMHKMGLSAPEDFRIIGFNDTEASAFSDPPLSTVPQNFDDVSIWLLRNALALAKGEVAQSPGGQKPRLLVRETCGGKDRVDAQMRKNLSQMVFISDSQSSGNAPAAG